MKHSFSFLVSLLVLSVAGLLRFNGAVQKCYNHEEVEQLTSQGNQRLLVAIAAFHVPWRERFLFEVIKTYASYTTIFVDIIIDTNSDALRSKVEHFYAKHKFGRGKLTVYVWGPQDMLRFRSADLEFSYFKKVGKDEVFWDLSRIHRSHFKAYVKTYDFFLYTEDDVAVSEDRFQFYLVRYRELWSLGWIFGFYRTEITNNGDVVLTDHERRHQHINAPIYVTRSQQWYVQPTNAYCAFWLLDQSQILTFIEESGGRYDGGEEGFDTRAKMAFGFQNGRQPGKPPLFPWQRKRDQWIPRVLLPIQKDGLLEPRALIQHLPNNYANGSEVGIFQHSPLNESFIWHQDLNSFLTPLSHHVTHQFS